MAVGFAITRSQGGAVQRNRSRRRLRAVMQQLRSEAAIPPGTYLLSPVGRLGGPETPFADMVAGIGAALRELAGEAGADE